MLNLSEIKELIQLIDQTSIQELEIENDGTRLLIRKPNKTESVIMTGGSVHHALSSAEPQPVAQPTLPAADPEPATVNDDQDFHKIVSPMVGTFYQSPSPDADPFINRGDRVTEKTVVCIVEAMKLMNPIEAEIKGEIIDILVENGQLVEYGQPLYLVKSE